jgi:hypothetical protein
MASLSLQLAQWNCIARADAGAQMGDGKINNYILVITILNSD